MTTRLRQFTSVLAAFSLVAGCGSSSPSAPPAIVRGPAGTAGYNSVALGSDGLDLISYHERISLEPSLVSNLKVAHCEDATCTRAIRTVVDPGGGTFTSTSIAIGADGLGLIAYEEGSLKVAHCQDTACTSVLVSTIDRPVGGVAYTSLTIGRDGHGLISYRDASVGDLRVAHCEDMGCTSATLSTLERLLQVGEYSSIAIGSDGLGLIAYYDRKLFLLKVAHCQDTACTSASLYTIDSRALAGGGIVGVDPHIAIGVDGLGLISYTDGIVGNNLKVAHCADVPCSRADVITVVDRGGSHGWVGDYNSVAIGRDGLGLIGYRGSTSDFGGQDLRVAHCQDVACRSAVVNTLDSYPGGGLGPLPTSVAIGVDGLGIISYAAGALKVAHCQNTPCTSATLTILD